MTGPFAGGGKPITLNALNAQMLTEYAGGPDAPLLVINTSGQLVWLAGQSGVGPANGVPLEPFTALPWIAPGQIWAIADPAATGPATVTVSGAIGNWQPSPAQIAAQITSSGLAAAIAQQILATGVPNVYNWTDLGSFVVPIGPIQFVEIDVHAYASVVIYDTDLVPAGTTAIAYWFTDIARVGQVGADLLSSPTAGSPALPAVVPVEGSFLRLNTNDAVTHTVRVIGTNRPVPGGHPVVNGFTSAGFQASTGNVVMAAGQTVPMNIDRGALFQGPAAFEFIVTGTTVKGSWILRMMTAQGLLSLDLADTTEAHVLGTDTHFHRLAALPAVEYTLSFLCNVAGTANAFTRAIPNY